MKTIKAKDVVMTETDKPLIKPNPVIIKAKDVSPDFYLRQIGVLQRRDIAHKEFSF